MTDVPSGGSVGAERRLEASELILLCFVLALGNFMAVLDSSIANVALPQIAGTLGATPHEGTAVITAFALAEAIAIPLTGWLANRIGAVRLFLASIAGFGVASALCGLSWSMESLVAFRVLQGLFAGPLMPLSQALMVQIVPRKQQPMAMGVLAMTIIVAPIAGPLLGGHIADTMGWEWAFYINVPAVIVAIALGLRLLAPHETSIKKAPIDYVGLVLLVVWVGALQLMLDIGPQRDWFQSADVNVLMAVMVFGFAAFVIWEITDEHPIVNLRVFRYRSFSIATTLSSITFLVFFASIVLVPLWLQTNMGYTAAWAGNLLAFNGVLAIVMAPFVARLAGRIDVRILVMVGLLGTAAAMGARLLFTTQIAFEQMALVQLAQGAFMPFIFIPFMTIALNGVASGDIAAASGLYAFSRTISGAIGAAVSATVWANASVAMRSELVASSPGGGGDALGALSARGLSPQEAFASLNGAIESQAVMLATNEVFAYCVVALLAVGLLAFLLPKTIAGAPPVAH